MNQSTAQSVDASFVSQSDAAWSALANSTRKAAKKEAVAANDATVKLTKKQMQKEANRNQNEAKRLKKEARKASVAAYEEAFGGMPQEKMYLKMEKDAALLATNILRDIREHGLSKHRRNNVLKTFAEKRAHYSPSDEDMSDFWRRTISLKNNPSLGYHKRIGDLLKAIDSDLPVQTKEYAMEALIKIEIKPFCCTYDYYSIYQSIRFIRQRKVAFSPKVFNNYTSFLSGRHVPRGGVSDLDMLLIFNFCPVAAEKDMAVDTIVLGAADCEFDDGHEEGDVNGNV